MSEKDWIFLIPSTIQAVVVIISVVWAVILYKKQKQDSFEAAKQANRSRLTEAYMTWHAAVLTSEDNIKIASGLIRRAHHVLGRREKVSVDQTHAVHILYLMLNAMFLEWNYRNAYKLDLREFDRTVDHAINGIVNNPDPDYRDIADNFEAVFDDFPEDFKSRIASRLREMRAQKSRSVAHA